LVSLRVFAAERAANPSGPVCALWGRFSRIARLKNVSCASIEIDGPNPTSAQKQCDGFWHVIVHFGFVEIPDLPSVISQAKREGLPAWEQPTYYVERYDVVSRANRSFISRWRVALFSFMSRNSVHAVDRFRIPSNSLVEIGRRVEL